MSKLDKIEFCPPKVGFLYLGMVRNEFNKDWLKNFKDKII